MRSTVKFITANPKLLRQRACNNEVAAQADLELMSKPENRAAQQCA